MGSLAFHKVGPGIWRKKRRETEEDGREMMRLKMVTGGHERDAVSLRPGFLMAPALARSPQIHFQPSKLIRMVKKRLRARYAPASSLRNQNTRAIATTSPRMSSRVRKKMRGGI